MRNVFVIVCAVVLIFGNLSAEAGFRRRSNCCQRRSCCQPRRSCCQPRQKCCSPAPAPSCCEAAPAPAPSCCEAAPAPAPAAPCCGDSVGVPASMGVVSSDAMSYESSDAMVYESGNSFVEAAPTPADCGCGNGVMEGGVIENAPMMMEGAPVMEAPAVEGATMEFAPASEVPAAPVGDTSYLGAPALNPGEWVVEDSERTVETAEVPATTVSTVGEVIYDSAPEAAAAEAPAAEGSAVETAPAVEAPATDAVPSAPSEEKAAE